MTPEERLERVRMCLAEAGYNPSDVVMGANGYPATWFSRVTFHAFWRASVLAWGYPCCWPCAREGGARPQTQTPPDSLSSLGGFSERTDCALCGHVVDPFCAEDAELVP